MKMGPRMSKRKCRLCKRRRLAKANKTGVCFDCQQHGWRRLKRKDPRSYDDRAAYFKAWKLARKILARKARRAA